MRMLCAACVAMVVSAGATARTGNQATITRPLADPPIRLQPVPAGFRLPPELAPSLPGTGRDDPLGPFRAAAMPGSDARAPVDGVVIGGDWQLGADHAGRQTGQHGSAEDLGDRGADNRRSARGFRLLGELPEADAISSFRFGVEGRLQQIRIEDDAPIGAGSHLPDARIALVLRRAW